jgi:heterodisulfide reductase subunit A
MYATKEAMVAMEHDNELETVIFNIDVRAFGKGFEQFYQRAGQVHPLTPIRC